MFVYLFTVLTQIISRRQPAANNMVIGMEGAQVTFTCTASFTPGSSKSGETFKFLSCLTITNACYCLTIK